MRVDLIGVDPRFRRLTRKTLSNLIKIIAQIDNMALQLLDILLEVPVDDAKHWDDEWNQLLLMTSQILQLRRNFTKVKSISF